MKPSLSARREVVLNRSKTASKAGSFGEKAEQSEKSYLMSKCSTEDEEDE